MKLSWFVRCYLTLLRLVLIAVVVPAVAFAASAAQSSGSSKAKHSPGAATYAQIPLSFEANQGQADGPVRFLARGKGYSLFLTGSGADLAMGHPAACELRSALASPAEESCIKKDEATRDMVRMRLVDSLQAGKVLGEELLPGKVNYFIGKDPAKWRSDLPTYGKVRYSDVYPGVDLVYYGNQRQLEFDFVVAPGANPASIRLRFSGEEGLDLAANGDLTLKGAYGTANFHKPDVYQERDGRRERVAGNFRVLANKTVSFSLGSYDHSRALIIDPVLAYSTYLGGNDSNGNGDQANGIAVDSAGNAYVVGTTFSTNFPLARSFQSKNNAAPGVHGGTVFVTKLNAAGTALLYSTYLGGSGGDFGYGIAIDWRGDAYVTGATYSTDFPVTCGAYQISNPSSTVGAPTSFVTRLNPAGNTLRYSTYLGGTGNDAAPARGDVAQAIAVDSGGNAYVTGYTFSLTFPVTTGVFQGTYAGTASKSNAFVTKLDGTGTRLVYSTFLGGSGSKAATGGDTANAIALDASGDAFVAGITYSTNFPVTTGAFQTASHGSPTAFVTELNPAGTEEMYSTYLGGSSGESVQGIVVDSGGFAYVAGNTYSADFPVTAGVLEGTGVGNALDFPGLGAAGFVTKLSKDGTALEYSTYLESAGTTVTGLAVDGSGNAYVSGRSGVARLGMFGGFQETPDALPLPASTGTTAFLVKLDPTAAALQYATLFGGASNDKAKAVAVDAQGNAYVTGVADSTDFPVTTAAFQKTNRASAVKGSNTFVSKFALASEVNETAYPATPSNVPTTLTATSDSFAWDPSCFFWVEFITFELNTGIPGPAPTGTIDVFNDNASYDTLYDVNGQLGGVTKISIVDDPGAAADPHWTAYYSGDAVFQGTNTNGSPSNVTGCTPPQASKSSSAEGQLSSELPGIALQTNSLGVKGYRRLVIDRNAAPVASMKPVLTVLDLAAVGPKFNPPPAILSPAGDESALDSEIPGSQAGLACIAPGPTLTVTVGNSERLYGAANPHFSYHISGLTGTDTATVTLQTSATAISPVGTYPITATVTGAAASNYVVSVVAGTLTVKPATLSVAATGYKSTYGQTPAAPPGVTLTGFVNGETANVVSGAAALSVSATAASPAGRYPISVGVGTLAAQNYTFAVLGQQGELQIIKAPLTLKADNLTMLQGGPIPALTYSGIGLVNGDTVATAVSGVAALSTTATAHSKPGSYPIYISPKGLISANYSIHTVNGVMTIQ